MGHGTTRCADTGHPALSMQLPWWRLAHWHPD